jgi:proline dehydrogenase
MSDPNNPSGISFDNTAYAFAYKNDAELKKARFLFSSMGKPWLLKLGLKLMPWAVKYHIPFTKTIIRNTIFSQFVGGETLEETAKVAATLGQYHVDVILDYGVEGGEGEVNFDEATAAFIRVVEYAASQPNIPFMSIKVTGIARFSLLEKLDGMMSKGGEDTLMKRYAVAVGALNPEEQSEWQKVVMRLQRIAEVASQTHVGVLVDAEESWIQDPVDALTILMMDNFNKERAVIYNTVQCYRHDRLAFLRQSHLAAADRNFILGVKIVRGAYMEKERQRAVTLNYISPIQADKDASDRDFNHALNYCIEHIKQISLIVASHNEYSNKLTTQLMAERGIESGHSHVHFSQLYGMSDNITFNLAHHGYGVSKYLPFGPIKDVVPYLMRRAQENSSVSGQTGRELGLINRELKRRREGKN